MRLLAPAQQPDQCNSRKTDDCCGRQIFHGASLMCVVQFIAHQRGDADNRAHCAHYDSYDFHVMLPFSFVRCQAQPALCGPDRPRPIPSTHCPADPVILEQRCDCNLRHELPHCPATGRWCSLSCAPTTASTLSHQFAVMRGFEPPFQRRANGPTNGRPVIGRIERSTLFDDLITPHATSSTTLLTDPRRPSASGATWTANATPTETTGSKFVRSEKWSPKFGQGCKVEFALMRGPYDDGEATQFFT